MWPSALGTWKRTRLLAKAMSLAHHFILASVSVAATANGSGNIGPGGPSIMNALGTRARAKAAVTPKTPSTPIGRAF